MNEFDRLRTQIHELQGSLLAMECFVNSLTQSLSDDARLVVEVDEDAIRLPMLGAGRAEGADAHDAGENRQSNEGRYHAPHCRFSSLALHWLSSTSRDPRSRSFPRRSSEVAGSCPGFPGFPDLLAIVEE